MGFGKSEKRGFTDFRIENGILLQTFPTPKEGNGEYNYVFGELAWVSIYEDAIEGYEDFVGYRICLKDGDDTIQVRTKTHTVAAAMLASYLSGVPRGQLIRIRVKAGETKETVTFAYVEVPGPDDKWVSLNYNQSVAGLSPAGRMEFVENETTTHPAFEKYTPPVSKKSGSQPAKGSETETTRDRFFQKCYSKNWPTYAAAKDEYDALFKWFTGSRAKIAIDDLMASDWKNLHARFDQIVSSNRAEVQALNARKEYDPFAED